MAVAAWMRWQGGRDDAGESYPVDDPLAEVTAARIAAAYAPEEQVAALLAIEAIFPPTLAADDRFRTLLAKQLALLSERGAVEAADTAP